MIRLNNLGLIFETRVFAFCIRLIYTVFKCSRGQLCVSWKGSRPLTSGLVIWLIATGHRLCTAWFLFDIWFSMFKHVTLPCPAGQSDIRKTWDVKHQHPGLALVLGFCYMVSCLCVGAVTFVGFRVVSSSVGSHLCARRWAVRVPPCYISSCQ